MPNDLRISLSYLSTADLKRIGDGLKSNPRDTSPGWFVNVHRNEGYDGVVEYTRITDASALEVAQEVDDALAPQGGPNKVYAAVRAVLVDLGRTRESRRKGAQERLEKAKSELAAIEAESQQ